MKHSTGNALISSNHPGTFAIYSKALIILSDGHTCDGTFNVDMWTTWASRALNHVVSFSKRGGGSNLRLLVSLQHSHIYHQASETNQATNSTTKPPQVLYFEIHWQAPPTVISEYVRHLQTIFIHKLMFCVEEEKAQFCTLFVIFICHLCNYTCWTCWIR